MIEVKILVANIYCAASLPTKVMSLVSRRPLIFILRRLVSHRSYNSGIVITIDIHIEQPHFP